MSYLRENAGHRERIRHAERDEIRIQRVAKYDDDDHHKYLKLSNRQVDKQNNG